MKKAAMVVGLILVGYVFSEQLAKLPLVGQLPRI